jgi:hypothetical protein
MEKRVRFLLFVMVCFLCFPLTVNAFAVNIICWRPGVAVSEPDEDMEELAAVYYLTSFALNLRPTPSTELARIGLAPAGTKVKVLDKGDGEWFLVEWNGLTGYMFAEYLEPVPVVHVPFAPPDLDNLPGVELLAWQAAGPMFVRFEPFTVIDVRTGISWQMARFGGDEHADVETLTAADTAMMYRAFDFTWTWEPRPVLVILEGRMIAASINGMPHGIVTNHQNNVNGHFCLHFFGSLVHGSDVADIRHHNAVLEAFFTAFAW